MSEETAAYRVRNSSDIQTGLEHLENAILDVLRKAERSGASPLNAGEITRCAGIPYKHETGVNAPYYDIARGVLQFLESKGDVECPTGKWQITPQGASRE
ncbi:MAG: hypothetical protein OXU51_14610 [Candidatus Poribacteria bacterium]|nr:hypothetical protein [Candidatus Poribacteria bacterium]